MAVSHKEFSTAGKQTGLQIWRIEKLDLAPVPENLYGSFYTGDAYLVLHTVKLREVYRYQLHFWLGKECSQDESTAAAIFAVHLDDHLGGKPIQYRELQGSESTDFTGYFKNGITYKSGGVASGFHHVVTNDLSAQRLLHIKGRRVIRATQVPLAWSSFNTGDCFILDLGSKIYTWCGSKCNKFERLKAAQLARSIRDNERNCRAELVLVEDGQEPRVFAQVLGEKPELPEGDEDDDTKADVLNRKIAELHMVSDSSGQMKVTKVRSESPFLQSDLLPEECFILDYGTNNIIFVWKGQKANPKERKEAMKTAECFVQDRGYPANTQIQVLPQGGETPMFKQFFRNWTDKDQSQGLGKVYATENIAKIVQVEFDASKLHESRHMAAQYNMVDDGSGDVQIWRVENGSLEPVEKQNHGQFFGGDCYVILYTYGSKQIIYTWQGSSSTLDEVTASAFLTVEMDRKLGGRAVEVRVSQGKEPPHLLSLFKSKPLIVFKHGTSRHGGQAPTPPTQLFQVRRNLDTITRIAEVETKAASLNSNDAFLLKMPDGQGFLWMGRGASNEEERGAQYIGEKLECAFRRIQEGKEPDDFWAALGGKKEYQTSERLESQTVKHPPRLFGCSNKTGRFIIEEVPGEFTQTDLAEDDVMLLDVWDQVFVWIGEEANEVEKTESVRSAKQYIETDPSGRDPNTPLVLVKQGHEPPNFTGWFLAWEDWDVLNRVV